MFTTIDLFLFKCICRNTSFLCMPHLHSDKLFWLINGIVLVFYYRLSMFAKHLVTVDILKLITE